MAGPAHSLEEIRETLKNTPIVVEVESEPVAARRLFGEENPWFEEMALNLHLNDPEMLNAVLEFESMHEGYDYAALLPLITCPTLLIQGSPAHGGTLTNEEVEHAWLLLINVTVARMQTVGHPLHTQEKEPVLAAMLAFLQGLS